jgi:hypothetical protein
MSKEAMKLALEALDNLIYWDNGKPDFDDARTAIKALEEALAKQGMTKQGITKQQEQGEPVAHCEAGPNFCQQCQLEDSSLALAAAVRYVKNNTPKLVSDEICNALNHIPDATKMVGDLLVEYDMEKTAFAKDLRAVLAPQPKQEQGEPNIQSYLEKDNLQPVAWMDIDEKGAASGLRYWSEPDNRHEVALYITPPQRTWVGLTDDEIFETHKQVDSMQYLTFGKAIEAKLKEKNS